MLVLLRVVCRVGEQESVAAGREHVASPIGSGGGQADVADLDLSARDPGQ